MFWKKLPYWLKVGLIGIVPFLLLIKGLFCFVKCTEEECMACPVFIFYFIIISVLILLTLFICWILKKQLKKSVYITVFVIFGIIFAFIIAFSYWYPFIYSKKAIFGNQIEYYCRTNMPNSFEECIKQYGVKKTSETILFFKKNLLTISTFFGALIGFIIGKIKSKK